MCVFVEQVLWMKGIP